MIGPPSRACLSCCTPGIANEVGVASGVTSPTGGVYLAANESLPRSLFWANQLKRFNGEHLTMFKSE